jgi:Mrp family chromosome partitioning ATPase
MIVARIDKTTRDAAEQLREQLTRLNAPLLGVVANAAKRSGGRYYRYGYYGTGEPKKPDRQVEQHA